MLDGYNVIEQTDGTTTLHFFYDSNGEVIGFRYNGNDYFYVKNAMNDIIAITDSNKNIVAEYRYDPWGKVIDEDNLTAIGNLNPFRYRSYYYDSDIEMYYLQSRYYDAEVGRFINCDDVSYIGVTESEVSYNPFAYCENEPINNVDRFGMWGYDVHAGYYEDPIKGKKGKTRCFKYGYYLPYLDLDGSKTRESSESFYGTYYWAMKSGFDKNKTSKNYARIIAKACNDVDKIFNPVSTSVSNQSWHFNTNGKGNPDTRVEHAIEYINKSVKCFEKAMKAYRNKKSYKNKVKDGCVYFGYALHAIQDMYAHSDDRCYYVRIKIRQAGVNDAGYVAFWMHSPIDGTDTAIKRIKVLKDTEEITKHMLKTLYKDYSKVLIRSR